MELLVQEQTRASEHKSSGASSEWRNMSVSCPSEAVAAPRSRPSLCPLHAAGSASRRHSDPAVALTPNATSLPQEPGEGNVDLQTRQEAAGASPLVALGTSAHPADPQQPPQACLPCLFRSGQDQNVSEVSVPGESAHSPSSQLHVSTSPTSQQALGRKFRPASVPRVFAIHN